MKRNRILGVGLALVFVGASALYANHSWGGYHWARTSNPFTLKLGDNLSSAWKPYLATTSSDWSVSTVLDTTIVAGQAKGRCRPTSGRVEVCNDTYGNNGWLGVASISVSGSHITQGTVKLNDTYFNTAKYNTPAWRNLVTCQEVGHTFGLGHQDENFSNPNLGTCMDYTNDPDGTIYNQLDNQHPNAHDYDELVTIYSHPDSTTTIGQPTSQGAGASQLDRSQFGKLVSSNHDGRIQTYVLDLGKGPNGKPLSVITHVFWAGRLE